MPISTNQLPTLMNQAAGRATKLTMMSAENALKKAVWPRFTNDLGSTNKKSESQTDYEPMGAMPMWPENTSMRELMINEGWSLRVSQIFWAAKFLITYQMFLLDQSNLMASGPKFLADASARTKEIILTAYFVYGTLAAASIPKLNGVSIITPKTGDGQPIFSTAHKWRGNTAYSFANLLSTYVHPTESGVDAVRTLVSRWRAPNNDPLDIAPRDMMIPIELEKLVRKFQKTVGDRGEVLTANIAGNVWNEWVPGGYFVNKRLPSVSDWVMLTDCTDGRIGIKTSDPGTPMKIPFNPDTRNSGVNHSMGFSHGVNIPLGYVMVTGNPPATIS